MHFHHSQPQKILMCFSVIVLIIFILLYHYIQSHMHFPPLSIKKTLMCFCYYCYYLLFSCFLLFFIIVIIFNNISTFHHFQPKKTIMCFCYCYYLFFFLFLLFLLFLFFFIIIFNNICTFHHFQPKKTISDPSSSRKKSNTICHHSHNRKLRKKNN